MQTRTAWRYDLAEVARLFDYMHARYFSPHLGRFMSVDPSQESFDPKKPQSWNRYAYVRGNPLQYVDPDGRVITPSLLGNPEGIDNLTPEEQRGVLMMAGAMGGLIAVPFAIEASAAASSSSLLARLTVFVQSIWLNPEIQGAFAIVAAELADQGTPTGRFGSVVRGTEAFTSGQLAQFERQAASDGIQSLLKSRRNLQGRLIQHLGKLEEIIEQGGHSSSVEREIRNFAQQINAIDEVLKGEGGYAIVQGELVRLPRK